MSRLKFVIVVSIAALFVVLALPLCEDIVEKVGRLGESSPRQALDKRFKLEFAPYGIAERYFNRHASAIGNKRYLTVIDYTKPSCDKRMFVFDLREERVEAYLVAHGKNSGHTYATEFSNEVDSLKSCRGFFLVGEKYEGKHGTALVLHGLDKGVNDNAVKRGIVMHGADYVSLRSILTNGGRLGCSWGCPAVSMESIQRLADRLQGGSLLYIHTR